MSLASYQLLHPASERTMVPLHAQPVKGKPFVNRSGHPVYDARAAVRPASDMIELNGRAAPRISTSHAGSRRVG